MIKTKTTSKEDVDAYYDSDAINQSSLKGIKDGVDKHKADLDKREKGPEPFYFIEGSAVDTILTGEEDQFNKEFYVSECESIPSEKGKLIADTVFDILSNSESVGSISDISRYKTDILDIAKSINWRMKNKDTTKFDIIVKNCSEYFEDLKKSYGKKVLSKKQKKKVDAVVSSFLNSDVTKKYFSPTSGNVSIYYQVPLYFEIEDRDCKALLDILVIVWDNNGNIKKVVPVDIKTMYDYTINFPFNARKFRYDIQASWYTDALINPTVKYPNNFPKELTPGKMEEVLQSFRFIVESMNTPGKPLEFITTPEFIDVGRTGAEKFYNHRGYMQLFDEYCYYIDNGFDIDKIVRENNGVLKLRYEGIVE